MVSHIFSQIYKKYSGFRYLLFYMKLDTISIISGKTELTASITDPLSCIQYCNTKMLQYESI